MFQLPIPRILIFFALGIALADRLRQHEAMPFCLGILLLISIFSFIIFRKKEIIASLSLFTSFMLLGAFVMAVDWKSKQIPLPQLSDDHIVYKATITSTPAIKNGKFSCDITTSSFNRKYKLKAYISSDTTLSLSVGDQLICQSRWNEPRNFFDAPHFDYALYLKRHGYTATTFIANPQKCNNTDNSLSLQPIILRNKLLNILIPTTTDSTPTQSAATITDTTSSTPTQSAATITNITDITDLTDSTLTQSAAIVSAMVLGDKSQLSQQTKNDYSASGASHVLALSGLHISIILSILSILLHNTKKRTGSLIKLIFIWAFAFLVGLPISIIRVAIMFSIIFLTELIQRQALSLNSLFVAALTILIFSPQSLFDVSFQLSFTAVFFILITNKYFWARITNKTYLKRRYTIRFLNFLLVSLSAQLGTLPLILYHFGQIPVYFIITNIFIGLFATAILSLGLLTLAISFIPTLLSICQEALIFVASLMNSYTHFIASLPYSTIQNIYINETQVCICYLLIFLLLKPFSTKKLETTL